MILSCVTAQYGCAYDEGAEGKGRVSLADHAVYLSTDDGVKVFSGMGMLLHEAPMKGAGAICADEESVFCAGADGAIWRLARRSLMPQSIFSGGPGVCDLSVSPDGKKLFALVGEADSVLMSDVLTGKPEAVNCCGCNPQQLTFGDGILAVAGGESGCVHLYDPATLAGLGQISMPGPVYGAAIRDGCIYALCLTAQLNSILIRKKGASQRSLLLEGMPGCLYMADSVLLAATQGWLHVLSLDDFRLLLRQKAPGCAARMRIVNGRVFLHDPLSERAWMLFTGGAWRTLCEKTLAMAVQ